MPLEYKKELTGIYTNINKFAPNLNISYGNIVLLNFAYEMSTLGKNTYHPNYPPPINIACTSILSYCKDSIIHGRNMDWNLGELKKLIVQIDYYKSNKIIYNAITIVGYIGIMTGLKPYEYSITVNARNFGGNIAINLLNIIYHNAFPVTLLTRYVLENYNYTIAKKKLINQRITSPVYYIIGSNIDGYVITRDRNNYVDLWELNTLSQHWYLLETNYDHWLKPPYNDSRRYYAQNYLNNFNKNIFTLYDLEKNIR